MKKWSQVIRRAAPVSRKHVLTWDQMLQNAARLGTCISALADEDVSCTAPAMRHESLQIFFTPAIVFATATRPSHSAHFWQGAKSIAHAPENDGWNVQKWSEGGMLLYIIFTISLWSVLRAKAACTFWTAQLPKVVKWFLAFWLRDVLLATEACTFSTAQLPRVLRTWNAFNI